MPQVNVEQLRKKQAFCAGLDDEFDNWRPHYQALARRILPRRYDWLQTGHRVTPHTSSTESPSNPGGNGLNGPSRALAMNAAIYDSTGTEAARTLSYGLMNGLTSPARPWFNLRLVGFPDDIEGYPHEWLVWLEDTRDRMLTVLAESNFYGALAAMYADLVIFGIGNIIIYDDFDDIIRCYHSPVGQFRFFQDDRQVVQGITRVLNMQVYQLVDRFGIENVSPQTRQSFESKGAAWLISKSVYHIIEPNRRDAFYIEGGFQYRELYWEAGSSSPGLVLQISGFEDRPFMAPRWEVNGNDVYAYSPGMDALADITQIQHETLRKGQALDKLVRPPLAADAMMKTNPTSLLPGGIAWLPSSSSVGVKPIYTVQPPLGEMSQELQNIQQRVRRAFFNHLFRNVSDLDTVRTATEIAERKSEDMVILGAVLNRVGKEGLDPGIKRTYNIMERKGLFLDPPEGMERERIQIQYVSMLAEAQRSIGTASLERAYQVIGEVSAAEPGLRHVMNWDESIRDYFRMLGVSPRNINSRDRTAELRENDAQQLAAQQEALVGEQLTSAAQNLSQTEVGAGNTALDALLG